MYGGERVSQRQFVYEYVSNFMLAIIGFGSLLSGKAVIFIIGMYDRYILSPYIETSARSTFGEELTNFRLARVQNYRRVFAHPASIFFQRGIAKLETKASQVKKNIFIITKLTSII